MPRRKDPFEAAREVLATNRGYALGYLQSAGERRTRELLKSAAEDLGKRLKQAEGIRGPGKDSFTAVQLRATLAQVQQVTRDLQRGLKGVLLDQAPVAAEKGADAAAVYLASADRSFRGVGQQPLALRTAAMLEAARGGSAGSILRRIMGDPDHPAQSGVLKRYGAATVLHFERELQKGVIGKKSRAQMVDDLTERSPFLQGAPRHWAERIVRTESAFAMNLGQLEGAKHANRQLGGDMIKILSAVFDERTGADSANVHGQVRQLGEPFEYVAYDGERQLFDHPPDRPNDRGIFVPHRTVWPVPPSLRALETDAVVKFYARWKQKFHGRPDPMSTIPGFPPLPNRS